MQVYLHILVYGSSEYTNLGQVSLSSLLPCMAAVLLRVGRWGRSATLSSLNNNVHGPKLTESKNISSLVFVKIYFVWPLKPKSVGICSYLFWLLKYFSFDFLFLNSVHLCNVRFLQFFKEYLNPIWTQIFFISLTVFEIWLL